MKIKNWSKKFICFALGGLSVGFLSFVSMSEAQQSRLVKLLMRVGEERLLEDGTKVSLSKGDGDLIAVTISKPAPSPTPKSTPNKSQKTPFSKRIEVRANKMWVDTGIDVTDRNVRIEYESGQWRNSPTSGWNDGNGRRPYDEQHRLIVPSADLSSLVGKTNENTFFVGNAYEGFAGSGRLYLSINDIAGYFNDNAGVLYVTVSVE